MSGWRHVEEASMGKRSRSEGMVWRPARSRLRMPLIALCVTALIALIGYMNTGVYDDPVTKVPGIAANEVPVPKSVTRDAGHTAEPRSAPLPRQAAAPRRAPPPRGEVREASVVH
jgi:hypothetical protein